MLLAHLVGIPLIPQGRGFQQLQLLRVVVGGQVQVGAQAVRGKEHGVDPFKPLPEPGHNGAQQLFQIRPGDALVKVVVQGHVVQRGVVIRRADLSGVAGHQGFVAGHLVHDVLGIFAGGHDVLPQLGCGILSGHAGVFQGGVQHLVAGQGVQVVAQPVGGDAFCRAFKGELHRGEGARAPGIAVEQDHRQDEAGQAAGHQGDQGCSEPVGLLHTSAASFPFWFAFGASSSRPRRNSGARAARNHSPQATTAPATPKMIILFRLLFRKLGLSPWGALCSV